MTAGAALVASRASSEILGLCSDEARARQRLTQLEQDCPLPAGYRLAESFFDRTLVARLELCMVGLVATGPDVDAVIGSAAEASGYPVDRAYFELLERVSVMLARTRARLGVRSHEHTLLGELETTQVFPCDDEPARRRSSLSNGVALHRSWRAASQAALDELFERDAVLSSFRGQTRPQRVELDSATMHAILDRFAVEAYAFAGRTGSARVSAGVFLLPREPQIDPLTFGFAAASTLEPALRAAEREALQRLAFLAGEPLPAAAPTPSPTPDYHQDYYLYPGHHERLRQWLEGRFEESPRDRGAIDLERVTFIDLTPTELQGRLYVAKALSPQILPLVFGPAQPDEPPYPHPIA